MERLRVRVRKPITSEEMAHLKSLGCDDRPYLANDAWALFGASSDHEEALRALDCVESVEIMPTYGI